MLARKCARPAGIWRSLGRGRGGTASLGKRGLIPLRGQPPHGKPARPSARDLEAVLASPAPSVRQRRAGSRCPEPKAQKKARRDFLRASRIRRIGTRKNESAACPVVRLDGAWVALTAMPNRAPRRFPLYGERPFPSAGEAGMVFVLGSTATARHKKRAASFDVALEKSIGAPGRNRTHGPQLRRTLAGCG